MSSPLQFTFAMNPYLFGCGVLMAFWAFTYWRVKRRKLADDMHELWWASVSCSILGITEPLYVPAYWAPPSILKLYRWDLESFVFCFAVGGIAAVFWELPRIKRIMLAVDYLVWRSVRGCVMPVRRSILGEPESGGIANITYSPVLFSREDLRNQNLFLLTFFLALFGTSSQFNMNIIYDAAFVCFGTAAFIWLRRPRLRVQIFSGGITFTLVYGAVLFIVGEWYPRFFDCWNHGALSGISIGKAPIEEYLFALSFGVMWAPLYEAWKVQRHAAEAPQLIAPAVVPGSQLHHRKRGGK